MMDSDLDYKQGHEPPSCRCRYDAASDEMETDFCPIHNGRSQHIPAHGARKPNADEQSGDWAGDRDYEDPNVAF